jgi:hypothetical protein
MTTAGGHERGLWVRKPDKRPKRLWGIAQLAENSACPINICFYVSMFQNNWEFHTLHLKNSKSFFTKWAIKKP